MKLDRNRPLTQDEIEAAMADVYNQLEEETETLEKMMRKSAEYVANYKSEWYKKYVAQQNHPGAVKHKENWASYETADEFFKAEVSEAMVKAKRDRLTALRTQADLLRTMAANVRPQVVS